MARDAGHETMMRETLAGIDDLREQPMFGGVCWLWRGHLLCGTRHDGMLVRLGKGNDAWAMEIDGAAYLHSGTRPMQGWVRLPPEAMGDDALRLKAVRAAMAFVATLPAKE